MPELTHANLRQKKLYDNSLCTTQEKQTVKRFHEEYDRYQGFLVTGASMHQGQRLYKVSSKEISSQVGGFFNGDEWASLTPSP